ncbi:MAG: polysaccharide pyruvyl transferase family protein [Candidatus Aenigmatarchaeota archaeon]
MGIIHTKVFIKGGYGPSNLGDDVLLLSAASIISRVFPPAEITIGVNNPNLAKKWIPDINFVEINHKTIIKSKILIYGGGGQFYSFPLTKRFKDISYYSNKLKSFFNGQINLKKIINHIIWLLDSIRLKNNIQARYKAALSIGIGPFVPGSLEEKMTRDILKNCDYISVRDFESKKWCNKFSIHHCKVFTDIGFLNELWNEKAGQLSFNSYVKNRIAFIIRSWPHEKSGNLYLESMLKAARILKRESIEVTFVVFDKLADNIIFPLLVGYKTLIYDPERYSPGAFIEMLSDTFDLVVSVRGHGIILPATFGIPGICVEIEPKLRNVHSMLPQGTLIWKPPFLEDELVGMIREMILHIDRFRNNILKEVELNKAKMQEGVKDFLNWLKTVL